MKSNLSILQLIAACSIAAHATAADVDVYLIAGQSNSINFAGEAATGSTDVGFTLNYARTSKTFLPIYTGIADQFNSNMLNPNAAVTALATQLSSGNGVGVFGFGRNGSPLAIEPNRIDTWYPGDDPQNGVVKDDSMYGNFITWTGSRLAEITARGDTPIVRGIFWFQGERDGVLGIPGTEYETNFTNLLFRFRQDFGADLPVVAARIREVETNTEIRVEINQAFANIAAVDPLFSVVPTEDLEWRSATNVHLTATGLFDLASRWATALQTLEAGGSAAITWEPAQDTSGKSDFIEGQPFLALNAGPTAVTINTEDLQLFFPAADFTDLRNLTFSPDLSGNTIATHVAANVYAPMTITSTGDTGFNNLISSLSTPNASPEGITSGDLTLEGLTPGQPYLIQLFTNAHDASETVSSITFGDPNNPENTVSVEGGNATPGIQTDDYGQFAVGSFTAQGTSQTISITLDTPGSTPPQTAELLVNGGFELPTHDRNDGTDPEGWTVIEGESGSNTDRQVRTKDENPRSGVMALQLGAGNSFRDGKLYQTIVTEPGVQYEVSGYYFSPQGSSAQLFSVEAINGTGINGTLLRNSGFVNANNTTYRRLSLLFTATSTATTIFIEDRGNTANDNATLSLDDFSVVEASAAASPIFNNVYLNAVLVTAPSNFQFWSRQQGIPADPFGDGNLNNIPNVIEFSLGSAEIPSLDGNLINFSVSNGALLDGYTVGLEFSGDARDWTRANADTSPLSLASSTPAANGDLDLSFVLDPSNQGRLFWRVFAELPAP